MWQPGAREIDAERTNQRVRRHELAKFPWLQAVRWGEDRGAESSSIPAELWMGHDTDASQDQCCHPDIAYV
jgi:hypothetical protein